MVTPQYDERIRNVRVSNPALAGQIRQYVRSKLQEAQGLNALRCPSTSSDQKIFTLYGARDAVQVTLHGRSSLQLVFANSERPAYSFVISSDDSITIYTASPGTLAPITKYFDLLRQLAVGPAEQTVYGWAEERRYTTLFLTGNTTYQSGVTYPPETACYVLEGTRLPLRLTRHLRTDFAAQEWCQRFWDATSNNLHNLGERLRRLPRGVWLVEDSEDNVNCIWFGATDEQLPTFVLDKPYNFQNLHRGSTKRPGQGRTVKKYDLRNLVQS